MRREVLEKAWAYFQTLSGRVERSEERGQQKQLGLAGEGLEAPPLVVVPPPRPSTREGDARGE